MEEMDKFGNGAVTMYEFTEWWKVNGKKNSFKLRDVKKVFEQVCFL